MKQREERTRRLRAVQCEYETAVVAIAAFGERLTADPSLLSQYGLRQRDFRTLKANLEQTYAVRLFAEFETSIRSVWAEAFKRKSYPSATALLNGIAARRSIPQQRLDDVHEVRRYRNSIVHDESEDVKTIGIEDRLDRLLRFSGHLPADW